MLRSRCREPELPVTLVLSVNRGFLIVTQARTSLEQRMYEEGTNVLPASQSSLSYAPDESSSYQGWDSLRLSGGSRARFGVSGRETIWIKVARAQVWVSCEMESR
jgi:hypothetical protein